MRHRELGIFGLVVTLAGCGWVRQDVEEPAADAPQPAQPLTPVDQIETWLNALHVMKDDPTEVMEVQHYCDVLHSDLIQCVLYDTIRADARLVGVEYVIPEAAFEGLSDEEQALWHPHNYEVLSGMLVAPTLPTPAEDALMRTLLNSYGKTWHTWDMERPGHALPTGEPHLGWSFNAEGEAPEALVEARNHRLGIDQKALQDHRRPLIEDAHPQEGVDALGAAFPDRTPFPGVQERSRRRGPETR